MKPKFKLSYQISAGYLVIVLVAIIAIVSCFSALRKNKELDTRIQQVYMPFYFSLKDLDALLATSYRLTSRWVAHQDEWQEKKELQTIHKTQYFEIKQNLDDILKNSSLASDRKAIQELFNDFQAIVSAQNELMSLLKDDSSYLNSESFDRANRIFEQKITPQTKQLRNKLDAHIRNLDGTIEEVRAEKQHAYTRVVITLGIMLGLFIGIAAMAYFFSITRVVGPIIELKKVIKEVGEGSKAKMVFEKRNDEIGQIGQALASLTEGMNAKLAFAEQIGKGEYDTVFTLQSEQDAMGKALLDMRNNLKLNTEAERQRNWSIAGLAEFAEIIRSQNDAQTLSDIIISNIVRYTNSNQGSLFIVHDATEEEKEEYLQLYSCYAWDKKKFEEKIIYKGQGLVGQCWEEGSPVFLTQVPANYVHITSGLGYATPRSIFIVPLKINEAIYGVLELASFDPYPKHKQEFIVKVCENIAAAIASAKSAEQTRHLLEVSRHQTENLHAQEEEMRQNMEELAATQDEMQRILTETQNKERYLRDLMNASSDSILTFDREYRVMHFNTVMQKTFEAEGLKLQEKSNFLLMTNSGDYDWKKIYDRALSGESIQNEITLKDKHYIVQYVPMRDEKGHVFAVALFSKNVTDIKNSKLEVDRLLNESRVKEVELRDTMDRLQATMESDAKRSRELERNSSQLEAQKQMMLKAIEKLKEKEKEMQAQEEELRQTMEELQSTLEGEANRSKELDRSTAQLKAQEQMMLKTITKLKEKENETQAQSEQIRLKEEQLKAQEDVLKQMMEELQSGDVKKN
jgi:GAF domain-containing protein/HAMP domain-containing protein